MVARRSGSGDVNGGGPAGRCLQGTPARPQVWIAGLMPCWAPQPRPTLAFTLSSQTGSRVSATTLPVGIMNWECSHLRISTKLQQKAPAWSESA